MPTNQHNAKCIKKAMLLINRVLTILILEKVGAAEFGAKKPIMKTEDSTDLNKDKYVIVNISPDDVFKSFRAMVSSDYLRTLAEEFAQKAAAHFMTIIKGSEEKTFRKEKPKENNSRPKNDTTTIKFVTPPAIKKKKKPIVNKEEVLTLLGEPALDGDNLEQTLSDEITETTDGNTVRLKINGAYYKRHNLDIQPMGTSVLSSTEKPKTMQMKALKTPNITTEKPKWTTQIPTK